LPVWTPLPLKVVRLGAHFDIPENQKIGTLIVNRIGDCQYSPARYLRRGIDDVVLQSAKASAATY
jgi:hypothetical protein